MDTNIELTSSYVALFGAILFVFVGNLIGKFMPILRSFALPGAVLGGLIGLLAGPQVLGGERWPFLEAENVETFYAGLRQFPGLFITVVFACLMLGRTFKPFSVIWDQAKPQVVMGHLFAWGQYVVGLGLAVGILGPFLGVSELAGPLIAIGFQGGHGTASGLGSNFSELGFEAGEDFALAVATVGVLAGVVGGPFLANALKRRNEGVSSEESAGEEVDADTEDIPQRFKPNPLTGRLTVHLAVVGLVVFLGWLVLRGLQAFEALVRGDDVDSYVSDYLPLFSVVLLVGMGVQALLQRFDWDMLFDRNLFEKISSFALDMVIVGALATLSLEVLAKNWLAISILCVAGVSWNLSLLFLVGPRVYRKPWYVYGMGDLGGGTATTASGIMLINVADPGKRSDALESYANKQPFYEPVMGGGLVTAFALPTIAFLGAWLSLAIVSAIFIGWAFFAWRLAKS